LGKLSLGRFLDSIHKYLCWQTLQIGPTDCWHILDRLALFFLNFVSYDPQSLVQNKLWFRKESGLANFNTNKILFI
jgi:hypothetical protein